MSSALAIFGGTFDPLHKGHIGVIEKICDRYSLDKVHWIVSARPPHKESVGANMMHRNAMLKLVLADHDNWVVDDRELQRQSPSYTFDTLNELRSEIPATKFCMIIGSDSMHELPTWYRYPDFLELACWLVVHRPGYPKTPPPELTTRFRNAESSLEDLREGEMVFVPDTEFDVSSTTIRRVLQHTTLSADTDLVSFVDPRVVNYINQHKLYIPKPMQPEVIKDEVVAAVEDLKGQDLRVIDIADISDFADFMVVVSGTSDTHVKAIAREASDRLRTQGVKPLNEDGAELGEWVLVDFGDVVLHVMRPEVRSYYDLEKLWDEDVRAMVKAHREQQDE